MLIYLMVHQEEMHTTESEDNRSRHEEVNVFGNRAGYDKFTYKAVFTLIGAFIVHLVAGS